MLAAWAGLRFRYGRLSSGALGLISARCRLERDSLLPELALSLGFDRGLPCQPIDGTGTEVEGN